MLEWGDNVYMKDHIEMNITCYANVGESPVNTRLVLLYSFKKRIADALLLNRHSVFVLCRTLNNVHSITQHYYVSSGKCQTL